MIFSIGEFKQYQLSLSYRLAYSLRKIRIIELLFTAHREELHLGGDIAVSLKEEIIEGR
ncbi:hypothetical protein ACUXCC_001634 [Cytobacillus horneckiae]|uniref:hypothetical protein n=1 Tax=Cytobacillus horneckiae TaxID=549687 RepID=UPI000AEEFB27|nr:hypothetical protein [Cytobacillus horneckiae]MBN6885606.1 hypothetical protein [Cytobacillus horneckiae]MEC1156283.1 hypothetical protein [Cytobacillus horneckiae]MED2938301.1 hypothetical protein [Cytobacillus horneckiae]